MDHPNLQNIQHCHICSDHFGPSGFEGRSWPKRSMRQLHVIDEMLTLWLHRFHLYPVSKLCFLYSGDFSGKPGAGEVNRKVVFESNWETSFRKWHSRFKLGFILSAMIAKMFNLSLKIHKTTNRVMSLLHTCCSFLAALTIHVLDWDPQWQFAALLFANTRSKS